ncbi:MAG: glycosyltransferase 87 family protein [Acidobacteriota bacterium]
MSAVAREPHRPALAVAAVLLGAALQLNNGFYSPLALTLVVSALVCAWAALLAPRALGTVVPDADGLMRALLLAGVLGQLAVIYRAPIGMYFERPMTWQHPGFVPGLLVVAISAALAAVVRRRAVVTGAGVAIVAVTALLGALTYRGSPTPAIDVVTVHDEAFAVLARGQSPYRMTFPDMYDGRGDFYPPGMVVNGRVQYGFPYPPLSLVMTWPGHLAGDFRWSELAAWLVGAAAVIAAGRRSAVAVLAVALWLFTPRAFFALEQSWTEPLAVVWIGLCVLAASRRQFVLAAALVGLAAATKQYVVLAVPLALLLPRAPGRSWWHNVAVATAAGAAATVPVALFDLTGLVQSVVLVQVREVLRMDALSLAVPYAQAVGDPLPGLAYGLIVVAVVAVTAWRAPRTTAGFSAALAVTLFTTFAIGKKAFCNYYVLVLALLAIAIATALPAPVRTTGPAIPE